MACFDMTEHLGARQDAALLLDWFAGQALAGVLAFSPDGCECQPSSEQAAAVAYRYADAMMAERKRRIDAARAAWQVSGN